MIFMLIYSSAQIICYTSIKYCIVIIRQNIYVILHITSIKGIATPVFALVRNDVFFLCLLIHQ